MQIIQTAPSYDTSPNGREDPALALLPLGSFATPGNGRKLPRPQSRCPHAEREQTLDVGLTLYPRTDLFTALPLQKVLRLRLDHGHLGAVVRVRAPTASGSALALKLRGTRKSCLP